MGKVNTLLSQRLQKTEASTKMAAMARQSANGALTSFSGVFSVSDISDKEKSRLEDILTEYASNASDIQKDLTQLISITSEVKAINNQAALLHGERIKKAHQILVGYREGAFTAWLITTYGNRQTPYNLMQYYEFCEAMPKGMRLQIEAMPRQAVYTLASRKGPLEKKKAIVESYNGETKGQLLAIIREKFPLDDKDKRQPNRGDALLQILYRIHQELQSIHLNRSQKEAISAVLADIQKELKVL